MYGSTQHATRTDGPFQHLVQRNFYWLDSLDRLDENLYENFWHFDLVGN